MQATRTEEMSDVGPVALSTSRRFLLALLIDASHYESQAGIHFSSVGEQVDHYAEVGWAQGLEPFPGARRAAADPERYDPVSDPFAFYLFEAVGEAALAKVLDGLSADNVHTLRTHFDLDWYAESAAGTADRAYDPLVHYLISGWHDGYDPSPAFSTLGYLRCYPDIRDAGLNPFVHWALHGIGEGRSSGHLTAWDRLDAARQLILLRMASTGYYRPASGAGDTMPAIDIARRIASGDDGDVGPSFHAARYLAAGIVGAERAPFMHYLFDGVGDVELTDLFVAQLPETVAALCRQFDHAWYLYSYADVAISGEDAFIHYMTVGWREKRDPSPDFSTRTYLLRYPDVANAGMNPFLHYVAHGREEGRSGTSLTSNFRSRRYAPTITAVLINDVAAPLDPDRVATVVRQTYDRLDFILVGAPLSQGCEAVIVECDRTVIRLVNDASAPRWLSMRRATEHASGELLWFVDSDDSFQPDFLTRIKSSFADGSVQLAFGRTLTPDDPDHARSPEDLARKIRDWERHETTPAAIWLPERLRNGLAAEERASFLWRRRRLADDVWQGAAGEDAAGRWHLYLHMASGGQIATVRDALIRDTAVPRSRDANAGTDRLTAELHSLWPAATGAAARITGARRHILIVTHGIFAGGAENLPIQLANELMTRGVIVSLLLFNTKLNPEMRATLNPGVSIYEAEWVLDYGCAKFVRDIGCSLVHSHGVIGEMFFFNQCDEALSVPYVATLHGSYEAATKTELPETLLARIVRHVDLFVYTADKNLAPLFRHGVRAERLVKMINAMPIDPAPFPLSRGDMGIARDAVVFTLVGRGIPEKGWATAIDAFMRVKKCHPRRPMHLCLVGEGDEPDRLRPLHGEDPSISFLGFQLRIHGLYRLTDVAIVPSRFAGESFPLCIIQALQVGTPVVATDVGEIASMLVDGLVSGGIVVETSDDDAMFETLFADAMNAMVDNDYRMRFAAGAVQLAERYDMEAFTGDYIALYEKTIDAFTASRAARVF